MASLSWRAGLGSLALTAVLAVRGEELPGQVAEVWNLGVLEPGGVHATTLSVHNESCRGKQEFVLSIEGAPWLKVIGPRRLVASPGETVTTATEVDLRGVAPGHYDGGRVVTRCPKCPRKCRLDYRAIEIRLTVALPSPERREVDPGTALAEVWRRIEAFAREHRGRELTPEETEAAHARIWRLAEELRRAQEEFLGWQAVARKSELDAPTRRCLEDAYARLDVLVRHFSETLAGLQRQESRTDEAYARYNELLEEHRKWRGIAPPAEAVRNAGLVSQAGWEAKQEEIELRKLEAEADLRETASEIRDLEKRIDACLKSAIGQLSGEGGGIEEPGAGPRQVLKEPYSPWPKEDLARSPRAREWGLDRLVEDLVRDRGEEIRRRIRKVEEEREKMRREDGGGRP